MKSHKTASIILASLFLSACSISSGGTDGGVYRSDDGGKTFAPKVNIDAKKKISSVDVLSLMVDSVDPRIVYIGTKASGIFKSEDAGETWKQLSVSKLAVAKAYSLANNQSGTVYAAVQIGKRGKVMKTEDGGQGWKEVYSEPSEGTLVLSLSVNPKNPQNIYAGTSEGQIILTENGGESWRSLFWANGAVFKIAQDNFNPDVAYFAVFQKGIFATRDGGKKIESLDKNGSGSNKEIQLDQPTELTADPRRENWVYAGTESGLLRSKDSGNNWERLRTLNKPQMHPVRSVRINPLNPDEIVYAAAQDFYKSNDGGVNWATVQFSGGRTIEAIAYNFQNPDVIYVGMNKR